MKVKLCKKLNKIILFVGIFILSIIYSNPTVACGGGTPVWDAHTAIQGGITSPSDGGVCGIGAYLICIPACPEDEDHRYTPPSSHEYPHDTFNDADAYTWSATAGTFPYGNTGAWVTWKAPDTPSGGVTIYCTVKDDADIPQGEDGTRDDTDAVFSVTVKVLRIDKIRLYFSYGSSSPDDAYPYIDDQFKTRAVVWATTGSQNAYCDMGFNEGLTWWETGLEGPLSDGTPPPTPGEFSDTVIDEWPDNWPDLTIVWKRLVQTASDPDGNHNRIYSYSEFDYLSGWGEDNRSYNQSGMHRLRATATLCPGTSWEHSVISTDMDCDGESDGNEYALRICIKDPNIYNEPDPAPDNTEQRRDYLEWLSTYRLEPYVWGGEGYGGKDSGGNYAGGAYSYDGFGIDCSGLVSCGAYRAGYGWPYWRQNTSGLEDVSTAVSKANCKAGDILNKAGTHVISITSKDGDDILAIEASGSADKVELWTEEQNINNWINLGYTPRRLDNSD